MIVSRDSKLDHVVPTGGDVAVLASGFVGEGPVWIHERDELLFSDHRNSVRYRWSEAGGLSPIVENTNRANGMTRNLDGTLLACEHDQLVAFGSSGAADTRKALADHVGGVRINFGADPIVHSSGTIYFTGSTAPSLEDMGLRPTAAGTEFVEPKRDAAGNLNTGGFVAQLKPGEARDAFRVVGDFAVANGIGFSPDESLLYVVDTRLERIRAFPVQGDGSLDLDHQYIFFEFDRDGLVGLCDGMAVDAVGNVYCAAPGGVWVITPEGRHLGTISLGANERHTNCSFGGADWTTLYITTHGALASIELLIPGLPMP
jgi:gluconolactonase